MRTHIFWLLILFTKLSFAQQEEVYKEVDLDGNTDFLASIERSPDGTTLAIATGNGSVIFWDIPSRKVLRKVEHSGFSWGPYMNYSKDGKLLLLQQQFYTDFALNKDRPGTAAVMDVESGKVLLSKDGVHNACLTPDNQSLVTLQGDEISFWNIQSGEKQRSFKPDNITNAIAVSPKGDVLVVSQKLTEGDVKNFSSIRDDKKAIKEALKYREMAVFYDPKTFVRKYVASDFFDIVFSMNFSPDGNSLYLFNAPNTHLRKEAGASRNGYIQVINTANGNVSRTMFATNASAPIYKESPDGMYFAATSIEQKFAVFNSVLVFNRETGSIEKNFVNNFRLFEGKHNGRACFEYLPDHKTMAIGYGAKLALWEIDK